MVEIMGINCWLSNSDMEICFATLHIRVFLRLNQTTAKAIFLSISAILSEVSINETRQTLLQAHRSQFYPSICCPSTKRIIAF